MQSRVVKHVFASACGVAFVAVAACSSTVEGDASSDTGQTSPPPAGDDAGTPDSSTTTTQPDARAPVQPVDGGVPAEPAGCTPRPASVYPTLRHPRTNPGACSASDLAAF